MHKSPVKAVLQEHPVIPFSMSLGLFPDDVLYLIAAWLPLADVGRLAQTCGRLAGLCRRRELWYVRADEQMGPGASRRFCRFRRLVDEACPQPHGVPLAQLYALFSELGGQGRVLALTMEGRLFVAAPGQPVFVGGGGAGTVLMPVGRLFAVFKPAAALPEVPPFRMNPARPRLDTDPYGLNLKPCCPTTVVLVIGAGFVEWWKGLIGRKPLHPEWPWRPYVMQTKTTLDAGIGWTVWGCSVICVPYPMDWVTCDQAW
jgi:hypothetical protein